MPDLVFYLDDSIEYIEQINKASGTDNPITNPELLNKRKIIRNFSLYIAKRYLFPRAVTMR